MIKQEVKQKLIKGTLTIITGIVLLQATQARTEDSYNANLAKVEVNSAAIKDAVSSGFKNRLNEIPYRLEENVRIYQSQHPFKLTGADVRDYNSPNKNINDLRKIELNNAHITEAINSGFKNRLNEIPYRLEENVRIIRSSFDAR